MPSICRTLSYIVLTSTMVVGGLGVCSAQMLKVGLTRSEDIHAKFDLASIGVLWKTNISVPGAAYLRIFFTAVRSEKGGDYHIRFVNSIGQTLLQTNREEFEKFGSFVTREIPGSFIEVQGAIARFW